MKWRVLCAAMVPATSQAIVWGEPDGDGHPNVGALILKFEDFSPIPSAGVPVDTFPICSGSLVARDGNRALFLTAGHCIEALVFLSEVFAPLNPVAAVSFSSDLHADPGVEIPVDMNALYGKFENLPQSFLEAGTVGILRDLIDIGLIVLEADDPSDLPTPVSLPTIGLLDSMGSAAFRRSEFRAVGFGDDIIEPSPHTRAFVFGIREVAYPRPVNLTENWLVTQQHGPSGSSGVYFGDSGCPIFWVNPATGEETQVALASAPLGNEFTITMTQHFRIDTHLALEFIAAVMVAENF